jgi:hypothetical protein
MNTKVIGLVIALLAPMAEAKQYVELTEFVETNAKTIGKTLNATALQSPMELGGGYEFRRLFLRIQAKVGFNVEFANIDLVPELELVFQKEKEGPVLN